MRQLIKSYLECHFVLEAICTIAQFNSMQPWPMVPTSLKPFKINVANPIYDCFYSMPRFSGSAFPWELVTNTVLGSQVAHVDNFRVEWISGLKFSSLALYFSFWVWTLFFQKIIIVLPKLYPKYSTIIFSKPKN